MVEPIFLSIPALEVGIPVDLLNSLFTWVIPNALSQEKLSPGMPVFVFFAIINDARSFQKTIVI